MIIALLFACRIPSPSPNLGDCAVYPEGIYDYGQVKIGECLAGPTELKFHQNDDGDDFLLLTNANPYFLFDGGSFMSIRWDDVDLEKPINYIQDLNPTILDMPNFNGPIAITEQDIALLGVRHSEDGRTRVQDDHVYIVDVSDPASLEYLNLGPLNNNYITAKSDPVDVVIDNSTGLAFVANRTSHDISIIDTTENTLKIVPPWPLEILGEASFIDSDSSNSTASFSNIMDLRTYIDDPTIEVGSLTDDVWSFEWIEGTWRLWLPADEGFFRIDTTGNGEYHPANFGTELTLFEQDITTPFYLDGTMYYSNNGTIGVGAWNIDEQQWELVNSSFLSSDTASYTSPTWLINEDVLTLLFAAEDSDGWSIGSADYDEGGNLRVNSEPIVVPETTERISEPFVVLENIVGQWRLFHSVYDGDSWHIRQHLSTDGQTWRPGSSFSIDGVDVAAPVLSEEVDRFRMWYARGENGLWDIAYAESIDGENWVDFGVIYPLQSSSDEPPRIALNAYPTSAFRLQGEQAGYQDLVEVNSTYSSDAYGWIATVIAGQWLDTDAAGAASSNGINISSFIPETSEAFCELRDSSGTFSIGRTILSEESPTVDVILQADDENSVFSPVVWNDDSGYHMIYAIQQGEQSVIAISSSTDGQTWNDGSIILEPQEEWESLAIVPSSIEMTDDGYVLLYSGTDGRTWNIGRATSSDGELWERDIEPFFELGKAGSWDDSSVREGFIIIDEDIAHLWYSGFDGETWRIGYAYQDTAGTWVRNDNLQYSLPEFGLFHTDGTQRPIVWQENDQTHLWYAGYTNDVARVGRAVGSSPDKLRQIYRYPTVGDSLQFETHRGDSEAVSIPLDTVTEETSLSGVGLTALTVDEERGFLYVVSKLLPYIVVMDVRDDSQGDFVDRNYLDIEAVIAISTSSGAAGFRQVLRSPTDNYIYALNDAPEAVFVLDVSELVDDEYSDLVRDVLVGWLPTPVGVERDQGERTRMSVGPGQMALHPDEEFLFVSNFNANSLSVYNVTFGPHGEEIAEIPTNGENPYALAISPDGNYVVVSNYTGEITADAQANSTLSIIDVNPLSETYLQIVTQVVNQ